MKFDPERDKIVTKEIFDEHLTHYKYIAETFKELEFRVIDHDCGNKRILSCDYIPFIGMCCESCGQTWGIHVRDLRHSLPKNMNLSLSLDRALWAERLNRKPHSLIKRLNKILGVSWK
jgi:hypothetical protein